MGLLNAWSTSFSPYNGADLSRWNGSTDYNLVASIIDGARTGLFGTVLSSDKFHAMGFSSGGYMTSRMAFNFPGVFKSLAIVAGSYYNCYGPGCTSRNADSNSMLMNNHPPTLFLHGVLDTLVPVSHSSDYYNNLLRRGVRAKRVTSSIGAHKWITASAEEILEWF